MLIKLQIGLHQNGILKNGSMDYTYGVMMQMLDIYLVFMLVKMLEEVPKSHLAEFMDDVTEEEIREVFDDEEMLQTAEKFLSSSLNVSETSRNLYMHRNTLLYRLDKIEKATGLNIRLFPHAVTFRILTVLYKLLKK